MTTDRIEPHVWRIAAVVVIGAILSILDTTIVNVALDTLSRDLHSPLADIQWVATGYMLALAAVIPVSGWAAGRFGAKRLWVASVVLFTLGSALSGLAWSTETLVIFRVLQGVGGGMIMPVGTMMLTRAAGPARLGRIMSIIGMPMILAPIFGPTLGGLIIDHLDWRWIFYVNVPVGIVAVVMGMRLLPNVEEGVFRTKLDRVGLALLGPRRAALRLRPGRDRPERRPRGAAGLRPAGHRGRRSSPPSCSTRCASTSPCSTCASSAARPSAPPR